MHIHTPENQRLVTLLPNIAQQDHDLFKLADEVLQDAYINVWQQAGVY